MPRTRAVFLFLCTTATAWFAASCRKSTEAHPINHAVSTATATVEPLPAVSPEESTLAQARLRERLGAFYSLPGYTSVTPRAMLPSRGGAASIDVTTTYVLRTVKGERLIRRESALKKGAMLERRFAALTLPTGQWILVGNTAILDRSVADAIEEPDHLPTLDTIDTAAQALETSVQCSARSSRLGAWECEVYTNIQLAPAALGAAPAGRAAGSRRAQRVEYWFAADGFLVRTRTISATGIVLTDLAVSDYRVEAPKDPSLFAVPPDVAFVVASTRLDLRQQIILAMKKNQPAKKVPTS